MLSGYFRPTERSLEHLIVFSDYIASLYTHVLKIDDIYHKCSNLFHNKCANN